MSTSPNIGFPYIVEGQGSQEVTANAFLNLLDMLVQCAVIDRDLTAPPGSPSEGDVYIPAATATGAWAGLEDYIVGYYGGGWISWDPHEGATCYVQDENLAVTFNGTAWA